jgi:hypothetical protein
MGSSMYEISIPSLPAAVVLSDPQSIEHVLKHNELFIKGNFFRSRSWDLFGRSFLFHQVGPEIPECCVMSCSHHKSCPDKGLFD